MSQFPPSTPPPPPPPSDGIPAQGGGQPAEAGAAISYGWKKFQEHWGEILVALLIGFGILVVLGILGYVVQNSLLDTGTCRVKVTNDTIRTTGCGGPGFVTRILVWALFQFLIFLGQSAIALFVIRAALMIVRGQKLEVSRVMTAEDLGPYVVGAILVGIMTFVGFVLCIIPGILVLFFTIFWGYFVVDQNMGAVDAITASYNLVKDNAGAVLVFLLLGWLVTIAGAIACGVGLIVAIPVVVIATGYMYMRLRGEPVVV